MLSRSARTILEKAAVDNGFSIDQGTVGDWLIWKAHAAPARICLNVTEAGYGIGSDHFGAMRDPESRSAKLSGAPADFRAVQVASSGMLDTTAGTVWRMARSLPEEPLRRYRMRLQEATSATEVERLHKERIGQDIFREALMLFWDGACAVTGVRHPWLLRASHIVPWAECESDAERLDVHNGLLLAAHLDAAFDAHLISFDVDGQVRFGPILSGEDTAASGFTAEMRLRRTDPETEVRLALHRTGVMGHGGLRAFP